MKLLALFIISWIAGAASYSIIGSGFTFFKGKPNHKKPSSSPSSAANQVSATTAVTADNPILNPFATAAKASASAPAAAEISTPEISDNTAPPGGKLSARPKTSSVKASANAVVPAADSTAGVTDPKASLDSLGNNAKVGAATGPASIASKLNPSPAETPTADVKATAGTTKPKAGLNPINNVAKIGATAEKNLPKATATSNKTATGPASIASKLNPSPAETPTADVKATASTTRPMAGLDPINNAAKIGATAGNNLPKASAISNSAATGPVSIASKLNPSPAVKHTADVKVTAGTTRPKVGLDPINNVARKGAPAGNNLPKATATPKITTTNTATIAGELNSKFGATTPTADLAATASITAPKVGLSQKKNTGTEGSGAGNNIPKATTTPKITAANSASNAGEINASPRPTATGNVRATTSITSPQNSLNPLDNATKKAETAETNKSKATGTPKIKLANLESTADKLSAVTEPSADIGTTAIITDPEVNFNPLVNAAKVGTAAGTPKISAIDSALITGKPNADSEAAAAFNVGAIAVITSPDITLNPPATPVLSEAEPTVFSEINTPLPSITTSGLIIGRISDSLKATSTEVSTTTVGPTANFATNSHATTLKHGDITTVSTPKAIIPSKNTAAIPNTTAADVDFNNKTPSKSKVLPNYTGAIESTGSQKAGAKITDPKLNTATVVKSDGSHNSLANVAKYGNSPAVVDSTLKEDKLSARPDDVAATADVILNLLNTDGTAAKAITATDMATAYPASTNAKLSHEDISAKISDSSRVAAVKNDTSSLINSMTVATKHDNMSAITKYKSDVNHSIEVYEDNNSKSTVRTHNAESLASVMGPNSSVQDEKSKKYDRNVAAKNEIKATTTASTHDSNTVIMNFKKRVQSNDAGTVVENTAAIVVTESTFTDTNIVTTPTVAVIDSKYKNMKSKNSDTITVTNEKDDAKDKISNSKPKPAKPTTIADSKQDSTYVTPKTMNLVKVTLEDINNIDKLKISSKTTKFSITSPNVDNTPTIFAPKTTPTSVVVQYNTKPHPTTVKNNLNSKVVTENPVEIITRLETTTVKYNDASKVATPKHDDSLEDIAPKISTTTTNIESKISTASLHTSDKYHPTSSKTSDKYGSSSMNTVAINYSDIAVTDDTYAKVTKAMNVENQVDTASEGISTATYFAANDGYPLVSSTTKYDKSSTVTEASVPLPKNVAKFISNPVGSSSKNSVNRDKSTPEASASSVTPPDKYDNTSTVTAAENIATSNNNPVKLDSSYSSAIIREFKDIINSLNSDGQDDTAPLVTTHNYANSPAVDVAEFVMKSSDANCNINTKHSANTIKSGTKPKISNGSKTNIHHITGMKVITIPVVTTAKKCTQSVVTTNKPEQQVSSMGECEPHCPCCTGCTNIIVNPPNEKTTVIAIIRNGDSTSVVVILTK